MILNKHKGEFMCHELAALNIAVGGTEHVQRSYWVALNAVGGAEHAYFLWSWAYADVQFLDSASDDDFELPLLQEDGKIENLYYGVWYKGWLSLGFDQLPVCSKNFTLCQNSAYIIPVRLQDSPYALEMIKSTKTQLVS